MGTDSKKSKKMQKLVPNPTEMQGKDGILQGINKLICKDFRMGGRNREGG